jgi:hypothetical protein
VCVAVELGQPAGHARALPGPSTPPAAGPLGSRWPRGGANERHVRQADLQRNRGRSGVGLVGRDLRALEGAGGGGGAFWSGETTGYSRRHPCQCQKVRQRQAKADKDGQSQTVRKSRPLPPHAALPAPLPLLSPSSPALTPR